MTLLDSVNKFIEWRGLKRGLRTINGDVSHLTHFCMFMRDLNREVETITLETCIEWLQMMLALGYDENTVHKKAVALSVFFQFLSRMKLDVLDASLIPIPKRVFRFPRVANEKSYKKLLGVIPDDMKYGRNYCHIRNKAIIMLLWDTGARNGEAISLNLKDIDTNKLSAKIYTEKSRGTIPFREIFWSQESNEVLKKWLTVREAFCNEVEIEDEEAVFIGIKSGRGTYPHRGRRLQVNYVSEILRKYSNKAKLEVPLHPHDFRHRFGRDLAVQGENNSVISSLMGHARLTSSYPYTMLFGQEREEVARKAIKRRKDMNG